MAELPASLKPIKAYLELAKARAAEPVIAYHSRLFALQEAMAMRANIPKADMGFILNLMDSLEQEKKALGDLEDAGVLCENYAQDLFQKADDADRAGKSTLPTGKEFLQAAQLFEACKQFGELPSDILEKIKYAKWRFVEIAKATKERRAPAPPRGLEKQPDDESGAGDGGQGPSDAGGPLDMMPPAGVPPVMPPAVGGMDSFGGIPPAPDGGGAPPPDYFGLPPAPPPGGQPLPPNFDMPQPPSFSQLPAPPAVPGMVPGMGGMMPPPYAPPAAPGMPMPAGMPMPLGGCAEYPPAQS